jgi:hypothetical protein
MLYSFKPLHEGRAKHKLAVIGRRRFVNRRRSSFPSDTDFRTRVAMHAVVPNRRRSLLQWRPRIMIWRRRMAPVVVRWCCYTPPTTTRRYAQDNSFFAPAQAAVYRPPSPSGPSARAARRPLPARTSPRAPTCLGRCRPRRPRVSCPARQSPLARLPRALDRPPLARSAPRPTRALRRRLPGQAPRGQALYERVARLPDQASRPGLWAGL